MTKAKLHIEGATGRPRAIKHYLDLIDSRSYGSEEEVMADAYVEFDLTRPNHADREVDTKNMTTTLVKLGLIKDEDRQELTDLGEQFVDVIIYNEDIFFEILHLLYATAYYRNPTPNTAISWSYYQISSSLRRRAPIDYSRARQEVVEEVMGLAKEAKVSEFGEVGALSERSMNNYRRFIEELQPGVLDDSGEFHLRSFAEKAVVLGAIDAIYRSDTLFESLNYGDLLELSDRTTEILGTILLVDDAELTDVIEHAASMDGRLTIKSDYQIRVRLSDPVDINDLA